MRHLLLSFIFFASSFAQAQLTPKQQIREFEAGLKRLENTIEVTRQKMKDVKDVTFLPDLYFVLAEMYVEQARTLFVLEQSKNPKVPLEELNTLNAYKAKRQAIEVYQRFIENFPKHSMVDRAYFFIAHEYREMSNYDEMIKQYQKIVRDFPQSNFWEESQLIMGDYFLETKKEPEIATEFYQKILARPQNPFTPMARYKLGWCYINANKFFEALMSFEAVLTMDANIDMSNLPEIYRKTDVRRDSLLAMVWPYSEQVKIDPDRADPLIYFERLSPNRVVLVRVLTRLTKRLMLKERIDDAIPIYTRLIDLSDNSEDDVTNFEALYVAIKRSKKNWPIESLPVRARETMMNVRYGALWKHADRVRVEKNFEVMIRDWATSLHKTSRQLKSEKALKDTSRAYQVYMDLFPTSRAALMIELNWAEVEFNLKHYPQAGLLYERLSKKAGTKRQKELMDSSIQSYALSLKKQSELSKVELVQSREGFRDVGARFVATYPRDPANAMILFNIARTHYDERNYDQAVTWFKKFIDQDPGNKEVPAAGQMILDSYNQREDYDNMVKAGNELIKNARITNTQFKKDVGELIRQAEYRKVQNQAGDPRSREYAQNLLGFAQKYQGSNLGDQALYEAFVTLRAKKDFQLFNVGEQLILKHGDSKYAKEVVGQMGTMAGNMGDYRRAAKYYEMFAQKYPKDPLTRDLIKSAAQIRELSGDFEEAANGQRQLGSIEEVARLYVTGQLWAKAGQVISSQPQNTIKEIYWYGMSLHRQGNQELARAHLLKASKMQATDYEEKSMAAHALYLLAAIDLKEFKSIQLGQGGDEGKLVKVKSDKLTSLTNKLNQVISYGNGKWTIAALYEMGRAHNEFASFIEGASIPAGLTAEQQGQYKQLVAQQAGQFRTKANGFFSTCMKSAEQFEVFTVFVKGCSSKGALAIDEAKDEKNYSSGKELNSAKSLETRKKLLDQPRDSNLLLGLGAEAITAQDYSVAILLFKKILELDPKDAVAQASIGVTLLYMNDLEGAAEGFKAALRMNGKEARALLGLAGLYKRFEFPGRLKSLQPRLKGLVLPLTIVHPWMSDI